jgi:hypothetical protein
MESPTLDLPHARSRHHSPSIVPPFTPLMTTSPFIAGHLSSPQISRASAAAIRISVARGDNWDGFHLWHSLRWSMYRHRKPGSSSAPQPPFRTPSPFVPIDFGRPVSTRLGAHCLLHSLLRAGEAKMAAKLTERIMADGEELHPLSFGTLLCQLNFAGSEPAQTGDRLRSLTPPRKKHLGSRILELHNVMPMNPFTRIAVHLLNGAREHRWQRTTSMYESVFRACLIQGEILVASLLLALLLKDYQLRHACSHVATEAERVGAQDTIACVQSKIPKASFRGLKLLPHHNSYFLYQRVTEVLNKHCTQVEDPLFSEASQSLAILASELDARRIPYANLATLIKVMYSYPRCQHTVWVTLPSGERQSHNAYHYFHEVLHNLLCSFPDQGLLDLNTSRLPSLNVKSYNALLHYALRYRHSLALANRVLHHMTELRKPPLAPSTSTYNILLRSSTLMRRNDIAKSVLRIMPWQMPDNKTEVADHFSLRTIQGRNSRGESSPTGSRLGGRHHFDELLEDTRRYDLNIPKPKELLEPDNILLTSYMAHLVATGRPDEVAILITRVIPEFELPKESVSPEEVLTRWQTSVVHGVTLGPHFFAVALNALRKAGHRTLAERVWALACAAESKALKSGVTEPWCLSVHAYTAMLQLYADETKGWHADHTATCTKRTKRPAPPRDPERAASAFQKGMQVFRALSLSAVKVHDAAVRAHKEGREWKHPPTPPRADARFYNAALSLVYHRPGMPSRGSHQKSRSSWNHLLGKVRQRFLLTGQRPRGWTPELEEIGRSLRSSGYALPIGFRLRLVGRDEQATSQATSQDRIDLGARPYSFGRKVWARFAPYRLPTFKRRGLPLRGRWRRSGWSN